MRDALARRFRLEVDGSGGFLLRHGDDFQRGRRRLRQQDGTADWCIRATADYAAVEGETAIDGADSTCGQTHSGFSLRKKWLNC